MEAARKISKSQNLPQKISKSQNLPQKISKSNFFVQKNLKKSEWVSVAIPFCNTAVGHMPRVGCSCGTFLQHSCQLYAQGGLQLRYLFATRLSIICPGWVADAVPFCNATACQNLRMLSDLRFPEMSVVHCNLSSY